MLKYASVFVSLISFLVVASDEFVSSVYTFIFVSIESIERIIKESSDVDICVAQTEKIHNLCGVFSSNISLAIKNMIENNIHKIGYLIKNNKFKILEFPNDSEFININNQNDYEKALSYIRINNNYNN